MINLDEYLDDETPARGKMNGSGNQNTPINTRMSTLKRVDDQRNRYRKVLADYTTK
jgi:hypothetical protein